MRNSNNFCIVEFLASIFRVFVKNLNFLMKHNIVNIFIILNHEFIIIYPMIDFVLFSNQKKLKHIPACHSPGSNWFSHFAIGWTGCACYGSMLCWSNTQLYLKFSMIAFLPIWGPIWGPCDSLNHVVGRKNREKTCFLPF